MEADDGNAEDVVFSLNVEPDISVEALSAEDLAWVDSCLVSDSDTIDKNWDLLKDALLEIVDSQSLPHYDANRSYGFPGESGSEKSHSSEVANSDEVKGRKSNQNEQFMEVEGSRYADRSSDFPEEGGIECFQSSEVVNCDKVKGKKTYENGHFMEDEASHYDPSFEGLTFLASPIQPNQSDDALEGVANSDLDSELLSHVIESPTHVLSRILNEQAESSGSVAAGSEVLHLGKGTEAEETNRKLAVDGDNSSEAKAQDGSDDQHFNGINFSGNPFRPDYDDGLQGSVFVYTDLSAEFPPFEFESITDDIFKEWELNIPEEEDELIEELNETLQGNINQPIPSSFHNSRADTEESVDSLIAAIKDLSV